VQILHLAKFYASNRPKSTPKILENRKSLSLDPSPMTSEFVALERQTIGERLFLSSCKGFMAVTESGVKFSSGNFG
jgi:hypothetical protein